MLTFADQWLHRLAIDGRVVEERVYTDTAPLRAVRSGEQLEPLVRLDW